MSHVTHVHVSCHTHDAHWCRMNPLRSWQNSVMSLAWLSHVTRTNGLCHPYEWAISHQRINQSDEWVTSHSCHQILHRICTCESYNSPMWHLTPVSCTCVTWLMHTRCLPMSHIVPLRDTCLMYVCVTARKASWNKAGVEPVHLYRPRLTQNRFYGTNSKCRLCSR